MVPTPSHPVSTPPLPLIPPNSVGPPPLHSQLPDESPRSPPVRLPKPEAPECVHVSCFILETYTSLLSIPSIAPRPPLSADDDPVVDENNNDPLFEKCRICMKDTDDAKLLLCDECNCAYHTFCLTPKLKKVPKGEWRCTTCMARVIKGRHGRETKVRKLLWISNEVLGWEDSPTNLRMKLGTVDIGTGPDDKDLMELMEMNASEGGRGLGPRPDVFSESRRRAKLPVRYRWKQRGREGEVRNEIPSVCGKRRAKFSSRMIRLAKEVAGIAEAGRGSSLTSVEELERNTIRVIAKWGEEWIRRTKEEEAKLTRRFEMQRGTPVKKRKYMLNGMSSYNPSVAKREDPSEVKKQKSEYKHGVPKRKRASPIKRSNPVLNKMSSGPEIVKPKINGATSLVHI